MALYLTVQEMNAREDATSTRNAYQTMVETFLGWEPPASVKLVSHLVAADLGRTWVLWETDDMSAFVSVIATFRPWGNIEIVPVMHPEQLIPAAAAGGLFTLPS